MSNFSGVHKFCYFKLIKRLQVTRVHEKNTYKQLWILVKRKLFSHHAEHPSSNSRLTCSFKCNF
uniref:Uncharacterized protein n=1 Tax=Rhizophora mucronata TaxID=61149 RepID=A0A2P2P5A8_RHIMU